MSGVDREAVAALVSESRRAQGLGARVEDRAALDRLARILASVKASGVSSDRAA